MLGGQEKKALGQSKATQHLTLEGFEEFLKVPWNI